MTHKFDITAILRACNYFKCIIMVSTDGEKFHRVAGDEYDMWLNEFEANCNKFVVDSQFASLSESEEEADGVKVEVLNLVLDTNNKYSKANKLSR